MTGPRLHTGPANANGHRRRQARAQVLAEEYFCALCNKPVDKTLGMLPNEHGPNCATPTCTGCVPHPQRAEIDEDLPRSRGGSALDRDNLRLMHRTCNQHKSNRTLAEALAARTTNHTPAAPPATTNLIDW